MQLTSLWDPASRPATLLVAGRSIGLATSFAIGIIFARVFDPAEFGTYKQFFLVFATLYGLVQLGLAESLYYFVPRRTEDTGRYVANAMVGLGIAGGLCFALLYAARFVVANWFSNIELADYMGLLGLFLALTLVTTVFEIVMVSRKRHMLAAITYAVSDIARTALFILPALVFASLRAVFVGAAAFAALRFVVVLVAFWREFGANLRIDVPLLRTQLAYALPFALAVSVEIVQINFHQYVVASRVDAATFAVYAIGCLQIPLVDLIASSTVNVLMVRMAEEGRHARAAQALWHDTVARLAFLLVPLAAFLAVIARPLIIGLFTTTYAASVPIFTVWALAAVIPAILAVDGVLRVYAQTRFLLFMNLTRLAIVAIFIGTFMTAFGLSGAVLVTLLGTMVVKLIAVVRVARLMQLPVRNALPWGRLTAITARSLAAALPVWWLVHRAALAPMLTVVIGAAMFTVVYVGLGFPAALRTRQSEESATCAA
jgi:O-antigen/teichoic acid export membrane protein